MSQQKTLLAGILIGLGVAVVSGLGFLFVSGAVPRINISQLLVTPTHTPTSTPAPTATLSPEELCRMKVSPYLHRMNEILLMLISNDDTKIDESRDIFRLAQSRFTDLVIPDCADQQLRTLDTSFRGSVQYYIAWMDAVTDGRIFDAKDAEVQGDALFVLNEYIKYLEEHTYSVELQQFRAETNKAATKVANFPTRTPVSGLALYKACVREVFAFHAEIDSIYESEKYHFETLEMYARGRRINGIVPGWIDSLAQSLEQITVPTCVKEPREIVNLLRIALNTLKPGFREIAAQSTGGRTNADSYKQARSWVTSITEYNRKLALNFKMMPNSLAKMLDEREATSASQNIDFIDETGDDRPLEEYSLKSSDFPATMIRAESNMYTNAEIAEKWEDPATAQANFDRIGMIETYQATYNRPKNVSPEKIGTDIVLVRMTRAKNAQQAAELFEFLIPSDKQFVRTNLTVNNVDEVISLNKKTDCVEDGKIYSCFYVRIYFRKGNIIGNIRTSSYTTYGDITVITNYAQIVADRLNQ